MGLRQADSVLSQSDYAPCERDPTNVTLKEIAQTLERVVSNCSHFPLMENARKTVVLSFTLEVSCGSPVLPTEDTQTPPTVIPQSSNRPGRPILTSSGTPTERIFKFVDQVLKLVTQHLLSYIMDTSHFLHIINNIHVTRAPLPFNLFLVKMDVVSLYTTLNIRLTAVRSQS